MKINEIAKEINDLAIKNGFYDNIMESRDHYVERMCNNLHDEVSELHTAWRCNQLDIKCDKPIDLTYLEEELADIVIRALDNMIHLGVDPEKVISIKHNYNKTRSYRHGNKRS